MGTNYYLHTDFCPCCGKPKKEIHLGKCSVGWKFLIHKTKKTSNYKDFCNFIKTGIIKDEYGEEWTTEDFLDLVDAHQADETHQDCETIDGYDFLDCDFS